MPNLYKELISLFSSLLIIKTAIPPINKDKEMIIIPFKREKLLNILKREEGIKSVILIPIIIEIEKAKQKAMNLFILSLLILNKIIIPPSIVERPATEETKKAFNGLIIVSPLNTMNKILNIF